MKKLVTDDKFRHLIRISNTDLQGDTSVRNGLARIVGISHRFASAVLRCVGVDEFKLLGLLTEDERERIEEALYDPLAAGVPEWMLNRQKDPETGESKMLLGPDLLLQTKMDKDRLIRIRSWRGIRHSRGLKVRGQKTKSTGRRTGALGVDRKKK